MRAPGFSNHHIEGSYRNTATAPDGTAIFLNTYTDQKADTHKIAATAGADYEFTSELGAWTRFSRGNIFRSSTRCKAD